MNILSALFAGQNGFLRASESFAARAKRIAESGEPQAEDLVGLKSDRAFADANTQTIKAGDELLSGFIREATGNKKLAKR